MRVSIPRLRSVKFKNGATLHVIRNHRVEQIRQSYVQDVALVGQRRADDIGGYAVVVWAIDGGCSVSAHSGDGRPVGKMMVPEFVRNALIDYIAAEG